MFVCVLCDGKMLGHLAFGYQISKFCVTESRFIAESGFTRFESPETRRLLFQSQQRLVIGLEVTRTVTFSVACRFYGDCCHIEERITGFPS